MNTENGVKPLGSVEPIVPASSLAGKENHLASYASSSGLALTAAVNTPVDFLIVNSSSSTSDPCDARPWIPGGVYKVWVSAAVANAALLQLDASNAGQLVTATTGHPVARALEASSGAGIIKVQALSRNSQTKGQPAPVAYNTTATLTASDLIDGIITSTTAAAVGLTTPTGTLLTAAAPHVPIGGYFDTEVVNLGGTNAITITAGTDVTYSGSTIPANTGKTLRFKRTATTTWVCYGLR